MEALYFPARGDVAVGERDEPVAGPGEVVVAVRASGICHTDLEVMKGNYGASAFPLIPGHEFAGEIVEIGPGVSGLSVGDRVVIDPNLECGHCAACKRGWAHLCETLGAYGVTVNGGFAERSVVRADRVHPIGDISFVMAALAEPMGCALTGLEPLEGRVVERAVIFGAGPMGLLIGMALRARGLSEVCMVDLDEGRLGLAEKQGLKGMHGQSSDLERLRHGCDLAVDATGVIEVAQGLTGYMSNGGNALIFGICPPDSCIEISPFEVFRRQLTIFGTHSLNHNIPQALSLISEIGPSIEGVVTHRLGLADIAEVMKSHPPARSMKVQYAV
jgi:threonine dehydrogenase-like Zn-dependent dehydrogenase